MNFCSPHIHVKQGRCLPLFKGYRLSCVGEVTRKPVVLFWSEPKDASKKFVPRGWDPF